MRVSSDPPRFHFASPKSATKGLTHVVYTRDRGGKTQLFVNGKASPVVELGGQVSNWSDGFVLALGDELSGERPWLGRLHLSAQNRRSMRVQVQRRVQSASPRLGAHALVLRPA